MSASQEVGEIFGDGSGRATALLRSPTVIIAGKLVAVDDPRVGKLAHLDYVTDSTLHASTHTVLPLDPKPWGCGA